MPQLVVRFGNNIALAPFPLHELTQTITATINDTSISINIDSVLHEVLRLTDYKKNRLVRTCPTMLDRYAFYDDAQDAINSPLSSYFEATSNDEVPNGAYFDIVFTTPAGQPLVANYVDTTGAAPGSYIYSGSGGAQYAMLTSPSGVPITTNTTTAGAVANNLIYPLNIRFHSCEKLVLSPFIFADSYEWSTGFFGINNIQLVLNMKGSPQRVLRFESPTVTPYTITNIQYNNQVPSGPFANAQVNVQFLTPSLDLPLPSKNSVPYYEFPRFISTGQSALGATELTRRIDSQTIVLPQIPDYLIVYCKPSDADTAPGTQADFYFPITNISLNFDNFSGLLSSQTKEQLYQLSAHNGLEMDYNEWSGVAFTPVGNKVQLVGGFLIIKPGQDYGLQSGQAPGILGNYTLQMGVTIENRFGSTKTPVLFIITANSGFFETMAGSSRVIKAVLSEADIVSAEPIMEMTRDGLKRIVGSGVFGNLSSMLSKAVDLYTKTKPAISAVRGALPDSGKAGRAKELLGKIGYGMEGMGVAHSGAGVSRSGAGRKSLSSRLM